MLFCVHNLWEGGKTSLRTLGSVSCWGLDSHKTRKEKFQGHFVMYYIPVVEFFEVYAGIHRYSLLGQRQQATPS